MCDFFKQFLYFSAENSLALMELNIGEPNSLASISLVYSQNKYSIRLKLKTSTHQLRLNRTTSFNNWTRIGFSINQTTGILKYSENGVILAEMSIKKDTWDISWRSVAIGRSHSLAGTRFLKSFAVTKLMIERYDTGNYSIHKNTEKGNVASLCCLMVWLTF